MRTLTPSCPLRRLRGIHLIQLARNLLGMLRYVKLYEHIGWLLE